ncbi:ribonuclease P protein component [Pseudobacteriovorax antillogorgiicola]|uniref:Ribonuclease P protein component n=1 Tax=Pseudobacteriovorax antillogorgiicola TaxID=1513793 RepID=A0A1Y6CP68_9BACT|nr:ribonuclease P protein component [Pseudobacteriovorax antillogorgiicola]TCS46683.1 ribonuclease P protein component [Pseudobacteriovorax antillogorgiicola]SMF66710.1 ribonuclease P protein component [Pseudobacteriovorax antillogorgiicola]
MFSFPKEHRLLKRAEFKITLDENIKVVTPHLVVLGVPAQFDKTRMGLIVSRKVGIAVVRNKVKRLLRESFRSISDHRLPMDIVVIARKPAANADVHTLKESLQSSLVRLARKIQARVS